MDLLSGLLVATRRKANTADKELSCAGFVSLAPDQLFPAARIRSEIIDFGIITLLAFLTRYASCCSGNDLESPRRDRSSAILARSITRVRLRSATCLPLSRFFGDPRIVWEIILSSIESTFGRQWSRRSRRPRNKRRFASSAGAAVPQAERGAEALLLAASFLRRAGEQLLSKHIVELHPPTTASKQDVEGFNVPPSICLAEDRSDAVGTLQN